MIDGKKNFDQPIKKYKTIYDNIRIIATSQEDNYTACCLLDYAYFKNYYKIIAIDLSKQQALHADLVAIPQISFTANLNRGGTQESISFLNKQKKLS